MLVFIILGCRLWDPQVVSSYFDQKLHYTQNKKENVMNEEVQYSARLLGESCFGTGLNLLHGAQFQRFLSGKSVFLNSKFEIREFHAH